MNCTDISTLVISAIALIVAICSARYTRKQYLSGIRPILSHNTLITKPQSKSFSFDIINSGGYAEIINIEADTQGITISSQFPIVIPKDETIDICGVFTNNSMTEGICIKIKYQDIDGNRYKCKMNIGNK